MNIPKLTKYEKKLYVLLFLSVLPNPFVNLFTLFAHYTPPYHCNVDNETAVYENQLSTSSNVSGSSLDLFIPYRKLDFGKRERNKCLKYNYIGSNISVHSRKAVKCDKYTFYFDEGTTSAIKDLSMICEGKWKKTFATTTYFFGKMIGGMFGGWVSDRFGRRTCFLITTASQFAASFIISFTTNFTLYTILLFLMGWSGTLNFASAVVLGMEMTSVENRNSLSTAIHIGYALGSMFTPLLGYLFQDWRWFARVTGLVGILYLPYFWLLDESPRWLMSVGRGKEAKVIMKKMAKYNGNSQVTSEDEEKFLSSEEKNSENVWYIWFKLLKQPIMILQTCTLFFGWAMVSLIYYATSLNTNSLSGDRFLNCFYAGVSTLFAYFMSYFALEHVGRRNSYIFFTGTMGISIMIAVPLSLWSGTAVTIITMIEMMGATISYYVVYVYTGELYPTSIRQTALTYAGAFSRIGSMLAPFMIDFEGSKLISSMILGAAVLLSACSFVFFPKTTKLELPDTIEDSVKMKRFEIFRKTKRQQKKNEIHL